jgi:hypothetical protein
MRKTPTPLGALWRGLVAGALGAGAQSLFFKVTRKLRPTPPRKTFRPPELEQKLGEEATETVARRATALAARPPLEGERKQRAGKAVHFGFGGVWGALWGLTRESYPRVIRPLGVAAFSAAVWLLSDNLILPMFRLAAWPQRYSLRTHAYALGAHLAYGAATAAAYEAERPPALAALTGFVRGLR